MALEADKPSIRRGISTFVQVAVAALFFMAITQLAQAIVLRGLALLGARTDVATIVAIEDPCGNLIRTAPAFAPIGPDWNYVRSCPRPEKHNRINVVATVPSGQQVSLLVNGAVRRSKVASAARVRFVDVMLLPGRNVIAVATGPEALAVLQTKDISYGSRETPLGALPDLEIGSPIRVATLETAIEPRIIGHWESATGRRLLLLGPPDQVVRVAGLPDEAEFRSDGFAVVDAAGSTAATVELVPAQLGRSATFTRDSAGNTRVQVDTCLPPDSALAQWAQSGVLSARDFVARITGAEFMAWPGRVVPPDENLSTVDGAACRRIRAELTYPGSGFTRYPPATTLLETPFDTLRIRGFGNRLRYIPAVPTPAAGDDVIVRGSAEEPVYITPQPEALMAELNRPVTRDSRELATPSRFAAAWARAEAGLPVWVRALLSGIAAGAPIILLVLVTAGLGRKSSPPQRANSHAGLFALLLLALAAAAQPLILYFFSVAANKVGITAILIERRADMRPAFFDPYTPIALAVALMLVPALRSAKTAASSRHHLLLPVLCALASVAAAALLIGLFFFEMLPWRMDDAETWLLAWLVGIGPSAEYVLPIVAVAIAAGVAFAWIPIFWAFRAMQPGGRFFGASIVAGAAATILPIWSYLVEAGRVALSDLENRGDGGDVSWVSLLGSTLLPFVLFLVLLRAFREILATVAPADLRDSILRRGRTRNLLIAAAVLALPRMTLSAANPSTADMGIIEILGSFQSFGLVVAVLAAVSLLLAYGKRRARAGDLAPFRLTRDEIVVLSALFAGYVTLWTTGPLATAIALATGWFAFSRLVLEPADAMPPALADRKSAAALIAYRDESALLAARRKALEGRFTKGEDDYAAFTRQREALAKIEARRKSALGGVQPGEVKRRLLEFGPGASPFANGLAGAVAGLLFATLVQLASAIRGPEVAGPLKSWVDLAKSALGAQVAPAASSADRASSALASEARQAVSPDLLLFLGTLVSAYYQWLLLGFLFGFTFHRIRGDDGFVKALVFGSGVAIAFLLAGLFSVSSEGVQPIWMVPVFLFLLLVGVVMFDARSLSSRGQSPARLFDVYGFRTSLGYASFLGAAATFGPLLKMVRDMFK